MADLNRQDLIKAMVAEVDGLTVRMAGASLEAMITCITEALAEHKSISINNFGKFGVRTRRSRLGIHPQTQTEIQIPATIVPYFTPSVGLKQLVNQQINPPINPPHIKQHEPNSDISR
ncbi:bacterial nucleoid DNA-binding protein [Synechococcus sp. PCC 7502]|uniref:HU family DNA-binding protein n=1 Tax=Synechococcus sp. PCC 7502 TaxID=1173263 RepID=UPI00029FD494|nr:HU family DNA-binding protein [Synechococcus sp. PCC 7502]AFY73742.1 bacterial nucleoid DNA-binding protein [Synechococcus sp. PCC 7502]